MKEKLLKEENIEIIRDRMYVLVKIRKNHNVSQETMAKECGVSRRQISYLENGMCNSLILYFKYIYAIQEICRRRIL